MKNIYSDLYTKTKLNLHCNFRIKIMANIANSLNLKNKKILDIGCYDGTFLSFIKNKNKLFGIEASNYGYKESKKKKINILQYFFNDNNLPFKNHEFDLIVAGEIIEHIYDTDQFLLEIKRILKTNGLLLISTPNIASLGRRLLLFFGFNPLIETTPNKNNAGHIRYFTFQSLKKLLKENNFKTIKQISDIVNFDNSGKFSSKILAKILPKIGQSIIFLCKKDN